MTPIEMAEAMEGRARVRRKITNRENTGDRLSDQLEQAATMLRQQQAEIDNLAIVKYLNGVTISKLYAEIEALKDMLEEEGIGVSQKYLDERIAEMKVNK